MDNLYVDQLYMGQEGKRERAEKERKNRKIGGKGTILQTIGEFSLLWLNEFCRLVRSDWPYQVHYLHYLHHLLCLHFLHYSISSFICTFTLIELFILTLARFLCFTIKIVIIIARKTTFLQSLSFFHKLHTLTNDAGHFY